MCSKEKNVKNISIIIIFGYLSLCPAMNVDFCVPAALFLVQVLCIVYVSHNKKKKRERKKIWSWNYLFLLQFSPYSLPPLPSLSFFPNTLEKVSSTGLTLGWDKLNVELRGQAGLGGQVKEGEGEQEEEEQQYALRRRLAPKWDFGCQDSNGEKASPHLFTFLFPSPGLSPDKESPPIPLLQLGLFLPGPGAEDEAVGFFLISICPSWPTLGTQHPALEQWTRWE